MNVLPGFSHNAYSESGFYQKIFFLLTFLFIIGTDLIAGPLSDKRMSFLSTQRIESWDGQDIIKLSGSWDFYWEVLLESFSEAPAVDKRYSIPFIGSWHEHTRGEEQLPFKGFGTYQKRIILPSGIENHIVLRMPPVDTAVRVFCNGKEVYSNGLIGSSADTTDAREYKPVLCELESDNGIYDLSIQAANFDLPFFGFYIAPVIVSGKTAFKRQILSLLADSFIITSIFILAVFHLVTGLKIKNSKWYCFLSLSYFAGVFYMLVNGEVLLGQIGLSRSYIWKIHYLTRFLIFYFFFKYTTEIFSLNLSIKFKRLINTVAVILCSIFVIASPGILLRFYLLSVVMVFSIVLFSLAVSINGIYHKEKYSVPFSVSTLILLLFMMFDLITESNNWPILFNAKSSLGLLLFGLIHTILLADMLGSRVYKIENLVEERTRDLEVALWAQARHARMGEMLNFIAHQWQQYLYTISIYIESLQSGNEKDITENKRVEIYNTISEAVRSMFSTLKDFRSFLIPAKEGERFSAYDECKKVLSLMEDLFLSRGIEISIEAEGDTRVWGIKNELEQVFLNLLSNASDIFYKRSVENPRIWLNLLEEAENIKITIEDNGGGISKTLSTVIFEQYKTEKKNGSGIGLYMSRRIIRERFSGELSFEDGIEGARFIITIPRDQGKKRSV